MTQRKAKVAVVGVGYWGANVARNLGAIEGCELRWCCDVDADRAARAAAKFGAVRSSADLDELLADDELEAVAIATPVPTHAAIAARVLEAGKDCFVEKPMAAGAAEARRLAELAGLEGRVLMVGHLLEYHPGLKALAALVRGGELGDVRYIYSQRLNLGRLRADENALWSLGAHDVSMILALTGEAPVEVSARGESFVRDGIEDVVFGLLRFPSGVVAHMHLSWLDPHKERRLTVVGSRRMASFDDMAAERKLTVFDKGFDPDADSVDDYVARSGEARNPPIGSEEPLLAEMSHFVSCVRERSRPRTDAASGIRVVEVLDALQSSLEENGAAVRLGEGAAR